MKFFLGFVALCFLGVESSVLPQRISKYECKKSDPNYQTCFRQSLETVRSDFMKGIPELGFAGIEPLTTASTRLYRTMGFGTSVKMFMDESTVSGFSDAIIEDLTANPEALSGKIKFLLPSVQFNTQIEVGGSILWVPVNAVGSYQGHFNDVRIQMNLQFYKYQKNGVTYFGLDMDKIKTLVEIGSGAIHIEAVNEIQQLAADVFCDWYNANMLEINLAINPILQDLVSDFLGKQIADYISRVPADELLPE